MLVDDIERGLGRGLVVVTVRERWEEADRDCGRVWEWDRDEDVWLTGVPAPRSDDEELLEFTFILGKGSDSSMGIIEPKSLALSPKPEFREGSKEDLLEPDDPLNGGMRWAVS